jgi:hypothetical protein
VSRPIDHHLPLASRGPEWIDVEPAGPGPKRSAARHCFQRRLWLLASATGMNRAGAHARAITRLATRQTGFIA